MLPIRNISYLLPMCCSFWEKCKNSPETGLGCSTPLMTLHLNIFQTFLFRISLLVHFVLQTNTYFLFHELYLRLEIAHFPLSHHLYGTHCLWTLDVVTLFSHLRTCWRLIYITKPIYIDFMLLQIIHYICMFKLYIFIFLCLRLGIVHRLDWWRIINALLLLLLCTLFIQLKNRIRKILPNF